MAQGSETIASVLDLPFYLYGWGEARAALVRLCEPQGWV